MESQPGGSGNAAGNNNGGYLDTSRWDKEPVWLMKCPPVVARSFKSSDSSRPVAKVVVSIDPLLSNDDARFSMELTSSGLGNIPKRYSMEMSQDFVPLSVFSESTPDLNSSGKLSAEGKIKKKFDMRPQIDAIDSYGKLCHERTSKYMTRTRQIQVIDNDKGTHMRPMPGMIITMDHKKKAPVKGPEMKRTRRDRGEMEEIMFKLFERQPHWTLRQLIQETDQPEQFLKDILKDLCVYNNKGANQGTYELKPEYKRSVDEPAL